MSQLGSLISFVVVFGASLLQLTNFFVLSGVKPNLGASLVLAFSLFNPSWTYRFLLVFFVTIILKFHPGWEWEMLILPASLLIAIVIMNRFPWQAIISYPLAIVLLTLFLSVNGFTLTGFLIEAIYNLAAFWVTYYILLRIYGKTI